jgi:broad specificity phosphatase PhoE
MSALANWHRQMRLKLVFWALIALGIPAAIFAQSAQGENASGLKNAVILIIRHAEKTDDGRGLSSLGVARAKAYADYFKNFTIDGRALKLDAIFASKDGRNSHRPLLTAEPTAEALGLKVNDRYKNNHFNELVDEIKSKPRGENILIVWHHGNMVGLLRALGADPKTLFPKGRWPGHVYDWLIELRYDENGRLIESKRIKSFGDRELKE